MTKKLQHSSLLFYGLTGLMLVISIVSFARAFSWINRPFPGFLTYPFPYVGSLGEREWPGYKAGLRYMDRIVTVDGRDVHSGQDVVDAARERGVGEQSEYTVESEGQLRNIIIPVEKFTLKDFLLVFCVPFFGGIILYTLGFMVYVLKPNMQSSWVFLGLCFSLGTYMLTAFEIQTTYSSLIIPVNSFAVTIYPATFIHLSLVFPERKRFLSYFPAVEYIIYLPAVALFVLFQIHISQFSVVPPTYTSLWAQRYGQIGSCIRVFALFSAIFLIGNMVHGFFRARDILARQRARMILFGVAIAFLPPGMAMAAVNFLKVNIPWNLLVFFVLFFPASIAYSIVRHNLFDADAIIRRTVGYTVVTAVVVGGYLGVSLTLNVFLGQYQTSQSQAFPILFTLGVITIFNPLRNRVQTLVDRLFFRKEYDYGAVVDKVGRAITSVLDLGEVMRRLTRTFVEDMFVNTTSIMLFNPAASEYRVYYADGERKSEVEDKAFRSDGPLIQIIEEKRSELTRFDVMEDPKYREVSKTCEADFEAMHSILMMPLVFQDRVIGLLNLGEKKSGKAYNRQDIDLLHAVANQGAVAIENARLFQENLEKQRMEEELNIARELQMSMLPSTCPEIRGFEITASSMPAQEVGGDFYDFIEMGEDKAGLVIADVTGKSVSGALVMSSSRSVFRMLSEEKLTVGDIMVRANRRIKKDIKTGMFVALLYAVLDGRDKSVSLCSAGQTQPIHFSAKSGEAVLVETEGDNFPLGILDEADYQKTRLKLSPGDRVIFYTDGIVEAMNEKEEIFGFDRLIEVVREGRSMSADSLLKEILDNVNRFAGGAAQHDDLTVIVVAVE